MNCFEPNDHELARLESLLRSTAEFEPERTAPIGLATRALAPRVRKRAPRRVAYAIGMALSAAGAAAAVLILGGSLTAETGAAPMRLAVRSESLHVKPATLPPTDIPLRARDPRTPERPSPRISTAFEKRRIPFDRKRPKIRRANPEKPVRAVIAKAEVIEETVHRFETGILAPVMVATQDSETGETVLQPTLMEIPIEHRELVMNDRYDNPHIRQVSFEENK